MFTDENALKQWRTLLKAHPDKTIESLIPLYAISVLHEYGWPCKVKASSKELPPRNETFLGYFDDTGWGTEYWNEDYKPLPEEIPQYWLPVSVLPVPHSF